MCRPPVLQRNPPIKDMMVLAQTRDPELSAEKYETMRINSPFKIENYLQTIFTSKSSLRVWGSGAGPSFCWPLGDEVLMVFCWGWDEHLLEAVSWLISLHLLSSCCGRTTRTAGTCCRLYHRQQTEFLILLRTTPESKWKKGTISHVHNQMSSAHHHTSLP